MNLLADSLEWFFTLLFKSSIDLARNGWEVFNYTANVMAGNSKEWLENPENNWSAYLDEDGKIKQAGDTIVDEGKLWSLKFESSRFRSKD